MRKASDIESRTYRETYTCCWRGGWGIVSRVSELVLAGFKPIQQHAFINTHFPIFELSWEFLTFASILTGFLAVDLQRGIDRRGLQDVPSKLLKL